jgi:hypothetical protein
MNVLVIVCGSSHGGVFTHMTTKKSQVRVL